MAKGNLLGGEALADKPGLGNWQKSPGGLSAYFHSSARAKYSPTSPSPPNTHCCLSPLLGCPSLDDPNRQKLFMSFYMQLASVHM